MPAIAGPELGRKTRLSHPMLDYPPKGGIKMEIGDVEEEATTSEEQDNWLHRSINMRCGGCMFFMLKHTKVRQHGHKIGRCRRRAPTMNGWPVVFSDDWCGDHKLDEEKI